MNNRTGFHLTPTTPHRVPPASTTLCPKCGGLWDEAVIWLDHTAIGGPLFAQRDCLGCSYMDEVPLVPMEDWR